MKKVSLIAYDLNPKLGSECGTASLWLKIISKYYFVEVFVDAIHRDDILSENYQNVRFHFIEGNRRLRTWLGKVGAYNISNKLFINKVKKEINELKNKDSILLHIITPAGIHSYNDLYRLGIPVLIGPLGGGLPTPKGFKQAFCDEFLKNSVRDFFYKYGMKNKKWKEYFLNADRIIIGTELIKGILPEEVRKKSVVIFDTAVDVNFYVPNLNKKDNSIKKVLFAGSLESKKGIILLIEAIKLCTKESNSFVVEIAGGGPLKSKVDSLSEKYGLKRHVKLLGRLSKFELLHKYQNSDVFCLPTLREPGGTAILEAMACGLPVVTSNYGGPAYSVTDECGIKIEVTDYETYIKDLKNALIRLINNREERTRLGKNARKRVEQEFSVQAVEKKLCRIYEELIE